MDNSYPTKSWSEIGSELYEFLKTFHTTKESNSIVLDGFNLNDGSKLYKFPIGIKLISLVIQSDYTVNDIPPTICNQPNISNGTTYEDIYRFTEVCNEPFISRYRLAIEDKTINLILKFILVPDVRKNTITMRKIITLTKIGISHIKENELGTIMSKVDILNNYLKDDTKNFHDVGYVINSIGKITFDRNDLSMAALIVKTLAENASVRIDVDYFDEPNNPEGHGWIGGIYIVRDSTLNVDRRNFTKYATVVFEVRCGADDTMYWRDTIYDELCEYFEIPISVL